jgi:hypothetical protein
MTQAVPKLQEMEELETISRLFWNNINQQMMDYLIEKNSLLANSTSNYMPIRMISSDITSIYCSNNITCDGIWLRNKY